jgi:hypothetical protein
MLALSEIEQVHPKWISIMVVALTTSWKPNANSAS